MFETSWELAMLSPQQIATINAEIDKLEYARKHCSDFGILKLIDGWLKGERMKLESGDDAKHQAPNNQARIPSKPSE
jgi:hypothetical protein